MKNNTNEVKEAVYTGMCIYNKLKNLIIKSNGEIVSLEDKKYIGLYLGIFYSENDISRKLKERKNIVYRKLKYDDLCKEELLQTYNDNFTDILSQVDYESINNYFVFLLNNELIYSINQEYGLKIDNSNKTLVK